MADRSPRSALRLRCPVCRAPFRGRVTCSRCGADLRPLMWLATLAWQARRAARRSLLAGELTTAARLAAAAQRLHATEAGRRQRLLAGWLSAKPAALRPWARS